LTLNAGESAVFARKAPDDDNDSDDVLAVADDPTVERFDVHYSCLRCGTVTSGTEISRLPEIKCICGFKVFTKVRPPVVKSVHAI